jgi:hypothetical protein
MTTVELIQVVSIYIDTTFSAKIRSVIVGRLMMNPPIHNGMVITSPYYDQYINSRFDSVKEHYAPPINDIVCLKTPISFLNKLRYRTNYEEVISDAIDKFIVFNHSIGYCITPEALDMLSIIHFIILCQTYMELYGCAHVKEICDGIFMTLKYEFITSLVYYILDAYDGLYKADDDIMEIIKDEVYCYGDIVDINARIEF